MITSKRRGYNKLIALATASFFFLSIFSSDILALAPQSGAQNPYTRCEYQIACLLRSGQLIFADKPEDVQFLEERNRAKALLLSHGKILARKDLKNKPEELLRAIIHEQIEAIMQIMVREDRSKYSTLINMVLGAKTKLPAIMDLRDAFIRLFPEESISRITGSLLNDELLANHMIAKAFELMIARNDNLLTAGMSDEEGLFLRAIEDIINANKHSYFTGVFWDDSVRESKIRIAMANGISFAQVASQPEQEDAKPGNYPHKLTASDPAVTEAFDDIKALTQRRLRYGSDSTTVYSPDGSKVLVTRSPKLAEVFDLKNPRAKSYKIELKDDEIVEASFSDNGQKLLVRVAYMHYEYGGRDAFVVDLASEDKSVFHVPTHGTDHYSRKLGHCFLSPDGSLLYVSMHDLHGWDRTMRHINKFYDLRTKHEISLFENADKHPIETHYFSPDGRYLAVNYNYQSNVDAEVYDFKEGKNLRDLIGKKAIRIKLLHDGRRLFVEYGNPSYDKPVSHRVFEDGRELGYLRHEGKDTRSYTGKIFEADSSQDGKYIIIYYGDGEVKVFDAEKQEPIDVPSDILENKTDVYRPILHAGGCIANKGKGLVYHIPSGKLIRLGKKVSSIETSSDGRWAGVLYDEGKVEIVNIKTGKKTVIRDAPFLYSHNDHLSFSNDDRHLLVIGSGYVNVVFDLPFQKHINDAYGLHAKDISPDGRWWNVYFEGRQLSLDSHFFELYVSNELVKDLVDKWGDNALAVFILLSVLTNGKAVKGMPNINLFPAPHYEKILKDEREFLEFCQQTLLNSAIRDWIRNWTSITRSYVFSLSVKLIEKNVIKTQNDLREWLFFMSRVAQYAGEHSGIICKSVSDLIEKGIIKIEDLTAFFATLPTIGLKSKDSAENFAKTLDLLAKNGIIKTKDNVFDALRLIQEAAAKWGGDAMSIYNLIYRMVEMGEVRAMDDLVKLLNLLARLGRQGVDRLIDDGFDYNDRSLLYLVFIATVERGVEIGFGDFTERVRVMAEYDNTHKGAFRNLFMKQNGLTPLRVGAKESTRLNTDKVDTAVLDRHVELLLKIKKRIDSLQWLDDFSGDRAFNIGNLYYQMKRKEAIKDGTVKEGERFRVEFPPEETMRQELLKDKKQYYQLIFQLIHSRLSDHARRSQYLNLMRELIISDSAEETLVSRMRKGATEDRIAYFKVFYEDYKNHLPNSIGLGVERIKGLREEFEVFSREAYDEMSKAVLVRNKEADGYLLIPQGFASVFRGRAGITDCSFDMDKGKPFTRAMHEDTLYYFVYRGKELKGYVGLLIGRTETGQKVLTIDTINSASLDGEELLTNLFIELDKIARGLGCIGIALPENVGPSFNFDNENTIPQMRIYKDGKRITVRPLHDTSWQQFTEAFGADTYNSIEDGSFRLLSIRESNSPAGVTGTPAQLLREMHTAGIFDAESAKTSLELAGNAIREGKADSRRTIQRELAVLIDLEIVHKSGTRYYLDPAFKDIDIEQFIKDNEPLACASQAPDELDEIRRNAARIKPISTLLYERYVRGKGYPEDEAFEKSKPLVDMILRLGVQKIMVVGDGLSSLPIYLALLGRDVVFLDINNKTVAKYRAEYSGIINGFRKDGLSAAHDMRFIRSEIGSLDLKAHGLEAGSFDLVALIDLAKDPRGKPTAWYLKVKELLKPEGYVIVDESNDPLSGDLCPSFESKQAFKETFPSAKRLMDHIPGRYYWVINASNNVLYKIENNQNPEDENGDRHPLLKGTAAQLLREMHTAGIFDAESAKTSLELAGNAIREGKADSRRTIQRELAVLVDLGLARKIGTKYHLAEWLEKLTDSQWTELTADLGLNRASPITTDLKSTRELITRIRSGVEQSKAVKTTTVSEAEADQVFQDFATAADGRPVWVVASQKLKPLLRRMLDERPSGKWDAKIRSWIPVIVSRLSASRNDYNVLYSFNKYLFKYRILQRMIALDPLAFGDPRLLDALVFLVDRDSALQDDGHQIAPYVIELIDRGLRSIGRSVPGSIYGKLKDRVGDISKNADFLSDVNSAYYEGIDIESDRRQVADFRAATASFLKKVGENRTSANLSDVAPGPSVNLIQMRKVMTDADIDAVSARYGSNIGTTPAKSASGIYNIGKIIDMARENFEVSPSKNLEGAKVCIIGPGSTADEITNFLESCPLVGEIHIVDIDKTDFENIDRKLEEYAKSGKRLPPIYGYMANVLEMPEELIGKMDVVFERAVIDPDHFDAPQMERAASQIMAVLKPGGVFITPIVFGWESLTSLASKMENARGEHCLYTVKEMVEPEIALPKNALKEWANFIDSLKALGKSASEEPTKKVLELDKKAAEYKKDGQSLILYADDILENVTVYDLQHTIKNILAKHNTLSGGKIILFARKAANAKILEDMLRWAAPAIQTVTITEDQIQSNGDEVKEVEAVTRLARAKGAKEILALIRGPAKNKDNYTPFQKFASDSKIPLVIVGPDKALYSLAHALSMAMDAKLSDGARTAWLIMLPPIRSITDDIKERYEEYERSLQALVAA
jgi:SAM-dependent methyltransferase/WD40 repeat protein